MENRKQSIMKPMFKKIEFHFNKFLSIMYKAIVADAKERKRKMQKKEKGRCKRMHGPITGG